MADRDDFTPRLGRMRSTKARRAARYLRLVIAATNLARGGSRAPSARPVPGAKLSRGSGVGRVLATRGDLAAFRARRVIVKARIVRLGGKGAAAARAHLRYLERDGTTRDGDRGGLYGPESDRVDAAPFLARGAADRHQFRFILAPEDGAEYDDLKPLVRRLMSQVEADLGTSLDWVAVDHFNTGNPHSHLVVRGVDASGADLVIARDYLTHGMRERAAELVGLDLGPRDDRAIEQSLRAEIGQERFTGIDRRLLAAAREGGLVLAAADEPFEQSLRAGRLATLARMGLARELGGGLWRLEENWTDTLRRMGERGDIVLALQRAYSGREHAPAMIDRTIYDPHEPGAAALVGRIAASGLADEHADRRYVVVEAIDGRAHYVALGTGHGLGPLTRGSVVRIEPRGGGVRKVDRTIVEIAAANGGIYRIEAHLRRDPSASEEFARTHLRRLEALRRGGAAERNPDGSWTIGADHLARVEAYEAIQRRNRPVAVSMLSPYPVERLIDHEGATWLDRELTSAAPLKLREAGFGAEARRAQEQRRRWLVAQGFGGAGAAPGIWPGDLLVRLEQRELAVVADRLAKELGRAHVEVGPGSRLEGILLRREQLASGVYAVVGRAREFALVPWRPELEPHIGKQVSSIVRAGSISWTIGRRRDAPGLAGPPV